MTTGPERCIPFPIFTTSDLIINCFFQSHPSTNSLDEEKEVNSVDDKGFSADPESVVEARSSPPAESKPTGALPSGTEIRPRKHKCAVCKKMFSRKNHLTDHIRTVHDKCTEFKCEVCSREFGRKSDLKRHILTVHEKWADFKCEVCFGTSQQKRV